MAILILAERQKLSFDDRLPDFFQAFPDYGRPITVRHLLQHTSGLPDYEDLIPAGRTNPLKDRDVLDLLQRQDKTFFPPGDRFRYSNSGYALLALIGERVSGLSFAAFLKRNIFDPLDMANTVAREEGITTVAHRAFGYSKATNGFTRTDQSLTSAVLGDGGIYSSVSNLAKWNAALETDRIVSHAMLRQAFAPGKLNNGRKTNYGFGWQLNTYRGLECISHSGSTIGFRNFIARFPEKRFTVIVLTNRSSPIPGEMLDEILDAFQLAPEPRGQQRSPGRRLVGEESLDEHERRDG
jgi:CubicO group peptidase (beta-lactamase class C family)